MTNPTNDINDKEEKPAGPSDVDNPEGERRNQQPGAPILPANWNPPTADEAPQPQPMQQPQRMPSNGSDTSSYGVIGKARFPLRPDEVAEFEKARLYMGISLVIAATSLFLGGMLVSGIGLVCALVANERLRKLAAKKNDDPEAQRALRHAGTVAIVAAACALGLNALSAFVLYPYLVNSGQWSGISDLLGSNSAGTGTGTSTWG